MVIGTEEAGTQTKIKSRNAATQTERDIRSLADEMYDLEKETNAIFVVKRKKYLFAKTAFFCMNETNILRRFLA